MADVEISYGGSTIVSMNDSGTEVLETDQTFLTDDITVAYTRSAIPSASDNTPATIGTASAGTSDDYSRADHVHAMPPTATPSITLNTVSGFTFSDFICRKKNGWAYLQIVVEVTASPSNSSVTICTLPAGYRPGFAVKARSPGQSGGHYFNFDVSTAGAFTVSRNPTQVAAKTRICVSFPVAD